MNIAQSAIPNQAPSEPKARDQTKAIEAAKSQPASPSGNILARVNVVEPSITLVDEQSKTDTQALVVKVLTSSHFSSYADISKRGIFKKI